MIQGKYPTLWEILKWKAYYDPAINPVEEYQPKYNLNLESEMYYGNYFNDLFLNKENNILGEKISEYINLNKYEIFNEEYRKTLNNNIVNYYYNYTIGVETVQEFLINISSQMKRIMPFYNKLYETTMLEFDLLNPFSIIEEGNIKSESEGDDKQKAEDTNKSDSDGSEKVKTLGDVLGFTNAPPSAPIDINSMKTGRFARGASVSITDSEVNRVYIDHGNSISETNSISDYRSKNIGEHFVKKSGNLGIKTYPDLIQSARNILINVDNLIIEELKENFLLIY